MNLYNKLYDTIQKSGVSEIVSLKEWILLLDKDTLNWSNIYTFK